MYKNHLKYYPKYTQTSTGEERDSETGFCYFGARYYDSDLMTGWLSVDPMADKYPGLSPYAYCAWNPIKLVDLDGEAGVCVVDKENKVLTIRANYYVRTSFNSVMSYEEKLWFYSESQVNQIEKKINDQLNNAYYTVSEGVYSGYDVKFDLNFESVEVENHKSENYNDLIAGVPISNLFQKREDSDFFDTKDGKRSAGYTNTKGDYIIMNSMYDYTRSQIHEIFHTLFFNNDDAEVGIGSYNSPDYPNQVDINMLINNPQLKKVNIEEL